ncbi:MAG: hypothetical protein IJP68_02090 [Selenomonadaceae bacterium]|nr:hypothetical protein [Selenomonadaceae bacterium]
MLTVDKRRELLKQVHDGLSLLMQEYVLLGFNDEARESWRKECSDLVYRLAKRYVEQYEKGKVK